MSLECFKAFDDGPVGVASIGCFPEHVMEFCGTVDADSREEVIIMEERCPVVIDECSVRLDCILDGCVWRGDLLLQLNCPFEEGQSHECRFSALPVEGVGCEGEPEVLSREAFQGIFGHAMRVFAEDFFLLQVEAIVAVQVAITGGRLDK